MGARAFDLTTSPLHLLHRLSQCATALFEAQVAAVDCELTQRQLIVLMAIAADDGASQTQLAQSTGVDRSTMAELMQRLIAKQLVERQKSRQDNRAFRVHLTERGRIVLQSAEPALKAVDRIIERALPAANRQEFFAILQRIIAAPGAAPR